MIYKRITKEAEELLDKKGIKQVPVEMVGLKRINGILVLEKIKETGFKGIEGIIKEYRKGKGDK